MTDIKDRAREYLVKNSEYSEVYGEIFVAVDTMTAMIEFAEQETKELKEQIERLSKHILELQKDKGELTDKVADLKEEINKIAFARGNLEEENAELKHTIATLRQEKDNVSMHAKAMEVVAKTISEQLTKATEIIKKLYAVYYDPCVTESDLKYRDELFAEIKQFLSEVEQWKK